MDEIQRWYMSVPIVTRVWLTSVVFFAISIRLGAFHVSRIAYDPSRIFTHFEIYRVVTPFLFFGVPDFNWLFSLYTLNNMGATLENAPFASGGGPGNGTTADHLWTLCLGSFILLAFATWLKMQYLGGSLLMFVIYLWSKKFPAETARLMFFSMPAALLPWAMVGLTFIFGGNPMPELLGIAAAHLYFFITDELPKKEAQLGAIANTRYWLQTPAFLVRAFGVMPTGLSAARPGANAAERDRIHARYVAPQRNWGQGHRLGGD